MLGPRAILLLLLICLPPAVLAVQADQGHVPDASVRYALDARLDATNRLLTGRGQLSWRNPSDRPATELRFQLAWNAWRDSRSSWMRESRLAGGATADGPSDESAGFMDLTSLAVDGQPATDLLAAAHFVAPDDRNNDDRTVLAVPLPSPLPPGETIALTFAWNAHVPRPFDRAGVIDRTFVMAGWFPQIGVLQHDGWHCHQVRPGTRTFADFARYDVALTVPAGWLTAASGTETSQIRAEDGMTTYRFTAEDVQDFAWTTSPDYVERTDRITRAGREDLALRLLLQPEHVEQADRQFAAVRAAVQTYERHIATFPWSHLTIVDPVAAVDARATGHIAAAAYPMLLIGNTRWLTPWAGAVPEAALTNQIGRTFFAVDSAPDAVDTPWMDAGIAAFALVRAMPDAFPQRFVEVNRYFGGLIAWPYVDVPWRPDDRAPGTPWLSTLASSVGNDAMTRILSAYYALAAHHHPDATTFLTAARAATDQNLDWFEAAMARPDIDVDYAVNAVLSTPTESGVDTTVVIARLASGVVPIAVRVTFADGSDIVEQWDGRDASHVLSYRHGSPAVAVDIDPDHALGVERRRTNNSWIAHPSGPRAADKWSLRWMVWFQHTLMTYAFFV